jgi:hypothetical protein
MSNGWEGLLREPARITSSPHQNWVLFIFGGKAHQQQSGKSLGGFWRDPLLCFSTENEQDPENLSTLRVYYHQLHRKEGLSAQFFLHLWYIIGRVVGAVSEKTAPITRSHHVE